MLAWPVRVSLWVSLMVAALFACVPHARADYWEATPPNVPPQQFSKGIDGALWAISATYGWGCISTGTACYLETCFPVQDINGNLSLYKCIARNVNGNLRPGYAKLYCSSGKSKHGGCPEVKACFRNGAQSGNPIDMGAGGSGSAVKREFASDFTTAGQFPLRFDRYYSSAPTLYAGPDIASRFGKGWQSNFDGYAFYFGTPSGTPTRMHFLANGQEYDFMLSSGIYKLAYYNTTNDTWAQPRKGAYAAVVKVGSTYELTTNGDTVYVYNFSGQLTSIRHRGGYNADARLRRDRPKHDGHGQLQPDADVYVQQPRATRHDDDAG